MRGDRIPPAASNTIEHILQQKTATLRNIIEQLTQELNRRETISQHIVTDISEDYQATRSALLSLEATMVGGDARQTPRGQILEIRLVALRQERRQELTLSWRDQTRLTKELRAWIKEYHHDARWQSLLSPGRYDHHGTTQHERNRQD